MNKTFFILIFISLFILHACISDANENSIPKNIKASLDEYASQINSVYINYTQISNFTDYYYTSMNENPTIHPKNLTSHDVFALKNDRLFTSYTTSNQSNNIERDWIIKHQAFLQAQQQFAKHKYFIETNLISDPLNDNTHNFPPLFQSLKPDMSKWLINTFQSEETTLSKVEYTPPVGRMYIVNVRYHPRHNIYKSKIAQYWLAEKYNYMIVKSKTETQFSENNKNIEISNYTNWIKHGNFWFPTDSSDKILTQVKGSNHYLINVVCHLNDIKINNMPSGIFNVDLPPNSMLNDQIHHIIYRIGPNGKWIPMEMNTPPPQPSFLQRMPHWLFILSLFAMLLIVLDILQRWIRRRTYSS